MRNSRRMSGGGTYGTPGLVFVSTMEKVQGYAVEESLGLVSGNVVQSKNIFRDIMAGLKTIVGGEIKGYSEMMSEARDIALARMIENARMLGANAILSVRFTTSSISYGMSELLAYGTAVKVQRQIDI